MTIDYAAITRAVRQWLVSATGIPDAKVILENQSGPELERPYATVRISAARKLFPQDYRGQEYDDAQPQGSEIELYATGPRLVSVSVSVYTKATTGNNAAVPMLSDARDALELDSASDAFRLAGAAVVDASDIRDLSALLFTNFQGRAHLDLTLSVSAHASERVGYIDSVAGTGTVSDGAGGPTTTIPIAFSLEE